MKGPGMRLDLDVRRVWKCPECGREVKSSGGVVAQQCTCGDGRVWMTLQTRRPTARIPRREADSQPAAQQAEEAVPAESQPPDDDQTADSPAGESAAAATPASDARDSDGGQSTSTSLNQKEPNGAGEPHDA